jgi:uncharacterized membrane protein
MAGAAFRLVHYGLDPSLTIDDAMLSYNIASRTWIGLAHPLDFQQTAPLVFLWALKASAVLGGLNELALRAIPVLGGIGLPYAMWRLARRLLAPGAALLATAFTALSPILIEYSFSLKPYETDALIAVVLTLLTLNVDELPSTRSWTTLAALGALAILCSTPAVFVLAACGLTLAIRLGRRALMPLALSGSLWIGLFVATYLTAAHAVATSAYMQAFWDRKFLTPAVIVGDPGRSWDIVQRLPTQVFTGDAPQLAALVLCWAAAVAGVVQLARKGGARALLLAGPVAGALFASMVRR